MADILCGVDISSDTLDARIGRTGPWRQFPNSTDGIADLAAFCREHGVTLAVMEASGGYERLPFAGLWAARIPVALVDPRAVRRFAQAMGRLEKTDRIDSAMIVWYGEAKHLHPTPLASATQQHLTALVVRLRQLTDLRTQQTNQRRLIADPTVLATFSAVLTTVATQIRTLEHQVVGLIAADPLWTALDAACREIKGVADRTVARLLAALPEIGTLNAKAASKLTGLAPLAHDSGKRHGKRGVRGGRESVRTVLYVVARLVCRYDSEFAAFRDRLKAAGKPAKVIRVALAHKLLVRLNAKARDARKVLAPAV